MSSNRYSLIFPGQGSQSAGMLSELAAAHGIITDTFAEASDLLGYDLWELTQQGPDEKLRQTQYTQPVMYVCGVALSRLWQQSCSLAPVVVAGHSLGEFSALTAAGALAFDQGVKLVRQRADLMAAAVPEGEGGMAALLGMEDQAVVDLCRSISGERIVEAVNFNSPGQVAISGHLDAIEKTVEAARDAGARKAVMLAVSVPNHSSLMRDAGAELAAAIDTAGLKSPLVPVMQNTHATVADSLETLTNSLKAHVFSPVDWTGSYRNIVAQYQPDVVIELGPGKVLAGLGKRIERRLPVLGVDTPEALENALERVLAGAEA